MDTGGARVRVLPPLVFFVPLLGGLALHMKVPLVMPGRGWLPWAGAVLMAVGLALMAWAVTVMTRSRTTVIPWSTVEALVVDGPFARSRNPIYLADLLVYLGLTLWARSWWPLLLLPAVVLAVHGLVIRPEEAYLKERFGEAYDRYAARVRRWL
jgi:protein-S-isoprenylcysteine O-methyltransferase Ste14